MNAVSVKNSLHSSDLHSNFAEAWESRLKRTQVEFVQACPADLQNSVAAALEGMNDNYRGLRAWLYAIAHGTASLPQSIPRKLVDIYLTCSEAEPLHDCEDCGICIPVLVNRAHGIDSEAEVDLLPLCPACGGKTGWYLSMSRNAEKSDANKTLRRKKPR